MGLISKHEGYLMIDHRASPGLPENVARRMGIDPALAKEGKLLEIATLTCKHCKVTQIKNPDRTRDRGHCFKCHSYICDTCAKVPVCKPFEQVVDEVLDGKTPIPVLAKNIKE